METVLEMDGEGDVPGSESACSRGWTGHDGVRHPRRSAGGDRHHRDHRVPTEAARAVGQHRRRDQRAVEEKGGAVIRAGSFNECGQGTVEFALVTAAFLAAVIALGALWRGLEAGMFVDHALMSASHHIQMTMPGSVADVFLY